MPPRGRGGNFRGRGGRGRGRGGRGGKATSRFGPNRRFDGTRLADNDESESSGSESGSAPEDTVMEDIDSEDDDDEHTTSSKPYMALLQSFNNESSAPNAKRRKLDHKKSTQSQTEEDSSGEESHAEDQDEDTEKDIDRSEDEAEEQVEEKLDDEDDSEDEENPTDSFDVHFAHPNDNTVSQRVKSVQKNDWATKRALLHNMRATILYPGSDTGSEIPKPIAGLEGLQLKQKLRETSSRKIGDFDALQRNLGPLIFNYNDVLFCDRTVQNSDSLRELACLHALNHVFKTRDRVIKNNYKLAKEGQDADLELRDQGFTRPKVLFLLPTRNSALRMVNMIRDICEPDQQENRKRFDDGYVDKEAKFGADRPADFKDLFEGSDDDMFRLGMKFTRKTIKYFAQFYNSDILFASPLGLRMAIGSEEDKKLDFDFLSSVEMVIVDQADALLMQNWEHVEFIFEHMNLQPKDAHGCDFSRVRSWYLEDWAKYFRQTIIMSAFNTPELSELLRLHCHNWAGKVRLQPEYPGMLSQLGIKAKQTFSRFQSSSVDKDPDARFEYFTSAIVPSLAKRAKDATGTLIFIPSYLDFVRVRNYFATSSAVENVTFGAISEYADVPEASRARSHFLNGRHRVLLYTERAHHFRRYQFRGVQRVIFYGLPDNPIFYTEIAGGYLSKSEQDFRLEPGQGTVKVVFSKYDVMKLERIVGSKRVGKMIQDRGDTFEFI
ncbi:U3 small nucleolar RNA-associated protein 25 [Fusarium oxysporum f. sp. cepae]|uniref:U3 small nucleolar RNA-associated protein 25 n=1 Tax=Fusarium oxysporum f. sp. cepae TaxID=396571 RepID=A0A3L6NNB8_FUSOX|nr:U3 small nucleolar RNA-associated protein 25 [Fusarium oxysporum f. sp. cepae]RKK40796.1 U3 small nucleolar RNA-associated protein 25 [Fusarium oxysporum f. sp. cepae]RKK50223.1 U3 small nucleolar RNA-associated protein 25 [Fusarium oxysporum f. sp. cepae]